MEPARHLRSIAARPGARGRLSIVGGEARRPPRPPSESLTDDLLELLLGAVSLVAPAAVAELDAEIAARLQRIPTPLNEYGYDPWGFHPETARRVLTFMGLIYRYWFRVEMRGVDRLPEGRMLLIANHAGQLPFDAMMLMTGAVLDAEPPRVLRGMAEYWVARLPWVGTTGARIGAAVGTPKNCVDLLRREEAVIAFPEGVHGLNKPFARRYRLQKFGLGFMRLALEADAPIVPAVVIGSEEQAPTIANLEPLAHALGMPAFPIPALAPLLGPLGLFPLPVKYRILIGEPMCFSGNPHDEDVVVEAKVQQVRSAMRSMIERGLRERRSIFF